MTSARIESADPMPHLAPNPSADACALAQQSFCAYLDGELTGHEMAALSAHLGLCAACSAEFAAWKDTQRALTVLGPAAAPARLHADLRAALAQERARGSHLAALPRALYLLQQAWSATIAPVALRAAAGLVVTACVLGGLVGLLAAPLAAVQAEDSPLANLVAPRYLYSQVPPQPIETLHGAPVLVEAKIDERGLVYDFTVLQGPADAAVQARIAANLLSSVFQPATVFGAPVRGHVVMTYMGVSVRG